MAIVRRLFVEVVLGDHELPPVRRDLAAEPAASFRFARLTSSSERPRLALSSLISPTTCCASACVAVIDGRGLRGGLGGREESRERAREQQVWRQPPPRTASACETSEDRRTGWGRHVTKRGRLATCSDTGNPRTRPKTTENWTRNYSIRSGNQPRLWYGPALARAGQGEEGARAGRGSVPASACSCDLARRRRPPADGRQPARRRRGARGEVARRGARSLLARRATRRGRARLAALRPPEPARAERASLAPELRLARLDTRLSRQRLASRLRFIYDHGTTSSLDVLMGAKSLGDAMTQLDDFNRVAAVERGRHDPGALRPEPADPARRPSSEPRAHAGRDDRGGRAADGLGSSARRERASPTSPELASAALARRGADRAAERRGQAAVVRSETLAHAGRQSRSSVVAVLLRRRRRAGPGRSPGATAARSPSSRPATTSRARPRPGSRSAGASPRSTRR